MSATSTPTRPSLIKDDFLTKLSTEIGNNKGAIAKEKGRVRQSRTQSKRC